MKHDEIRAIRGNEISMIFQDPMTSLNPVYRIGRQIGEPLRIHKHASRRAARDRAIELLRLVGIPRPEKRVDDYPHQFSGGMRQRAMIAMALACDPDILIADEPTTALDVTIQAQILELMQEVQRRTHSAIIMITHDLGVVADMADRVLVMYAGKAVEYGTLSEVFDDPLHPYTWGLMDSIPRAGMSEKSALCPIDGQPPSLIDIPSGCSFHPRCPYAQPVCRTDVPPLRDVRGGHSAACHFSGDPDFVRGCSLDSVRKAV
jgi:oligopeptide transport system ATP-binding protein